MTMNLQDLVFELDTIVQLARATREVSTSPAIADRENPRLRSAAEARTIALSMCARTTNSLDAIVTAKSAYVPPAQLFSPRYRPRGVRLRRVCHPSAVPLTSHGEHHRVSHLASHDLLIRDREEVLLVTCPSTPGHEIGVHTTHSALVHFFSTAFTTIWDHARPGDDQRRRGSRRDSTARPRCPLERFDSELDSPDALDHEILTLLANGNTDASISRALGVGLRTVQRRVEDFQRRLGLSSRFQLGLCVGSGNLLDEPSDPALSEPCMPLSSPAGQAAGAPTATPG